MLEGSLTRLHGALDALLSCLDARDFPEAAALDVAWLHVQHAFEELCVQLDGRQLSQPQRDDARERVNLCLCLYAVAVGELALRREGVQRERVACIAARQRLRRLLPESESGGSCDVLS